MKYKALVSKLLLFFLSKVFNLIFFNYFFYIISVAGQVENSWGSGCSDSFPPSGGAAKTDHCDQEGHARPSGGETLYANKTLED